MSTDNYAELLTVLQGQGAADMVAVAYTGPVGDFLAVEAVFTGAIEPGDDLTIQYIEVDAQKN